MTKQEVKNTDGGMFINQASDFQEIFTPEDFTREHKDIGRAIEDFIKGEIISRGEEIETLNIELSKMLMKKCGDLGFLGIDIPEQYGGLELDKINSAIVSEKFGYSAGSFAITELNSTGIGLLPVALFGTVEQKEKYLPGLASGELIGAFGLTEPEAGSDALNSQTTATLSEDGKYYLLNGSKQFITNAGFADIVFTYGKVDGKYFTAFIVEQKWEGVSTGEEENKMGYHGTSTRSYFFDNVRIPVENVLGEVGKGHVIALNALNMGRFKVGALCMGNAKSAFAEAVKYAKKRVQFGRALCEFGLIKEKISKMAIRLFAAESLAYRTAGLIQAKSEELACLSGDTGISTAKALKDYIVECSINKIYGSETEDFVVDEEVQIFGGYGYIKENHPELAYRNARINRIWEGTNEINRMVIVNTLSKKIGDGTCNLMQSFESVFEELEKLEPVDSDESGSLNAQTRLMQTAKKILTFVFGKAHQKYGKALREEQEIIGTISDIIIEIYAIESCLLRSQKMLKGKKIKKAVIPVEMTKVLFHDSFEKICFLAGILLQAMEDGAALEKDLKMFRKFMISLPINTVALRRNIADAMIQRGRYYF
ncbi:acyl-CoA dehydrogenase family protein [Desulfosarcina ovata]|uniref:Putative acyl-CoA dehydrogenase n=1 Tax=Desulfosarcina ovata subsp. ovata TaxID=2752305 RepID=A0A5K8A6R6_9BACT|nr:acyl-CoA dehydrogenase family protein [Desulfosarcina ovata]BBO88088.1 putative acyl-CoA dehydrogenase [Desulfosarcina ovata subsp. ovata]